MDKRASIITVITTPLGFFALALLIVEGFLGITLIGTGDTISPEAKVTGMYIAAGAFFVVILIVAIMVWKFPENLTLRGEDWNERARNYGTSVNPQTKSEIKEVKKTNL